jgi:TrmH family RNA methyltransferase
VEARTDNNPNSQIKGYAVNCRLNIILAVKILSKAQIKYIQGLRQKKFRDEAGVFVAEGPKLVQDLLALPHLEPMLVAGSLGWWQEGSRPSSLSAERSFLADEGALEKMSSLHQPSSVLAVFKKPVWKTGPFNWILLLDDIQDPGNLGTLIRTADWFQMDAVVCSEHTADVFNPKVVQATMGSIGRMPVIYQDLSTFLRAHSIPVYATSLEGNPLVSTPKPSRAALIIGNEGKGVSPALLAQADHALTIPKLGQAESLNAAVAGGILMHWMRSE